MSNWFECKVRYERLDESGNQKKAVDSYLVDALTFTEAEARITQEMQPYLGGEFTVANIRRVNINELFDSELESDDRWYRCKVMFVTLDEEKAVEKKTATQMYVKAGDIKTALDNLLTGLKGIMADYEIVSIIETPVMDVFKYEIIETKTDEN
jgi:hypothetical protein